MNQRTVFNRKGGAIVCGVFSPLVVNALFQLIVRREERVRETSGLLSCGFLQPLRVCACVAVCVGRFACGTRAVHATERGSADGLAI